MCFFFSPAAVSQGPLGPDGPLGETGPEGPKVSMQANLFKAPLHTCFLMAFARNTALFSVLATVFGARGSFSTENTVFFIIKLTPLKDFPLHLFIYLALFQYFFMHLQGERGESGQKGEPGFIVSSL